jgi:hypothetical protein
MASCMYIYILCALGSVSSLNNYQNGEIEFSWKYEAKVLKTHPSYCSLQCA